MRNPLGLKSVKTTPVERAKKSPTRKLDHSVVDNSAGRERVPTLFDHSIPLSPFCRRGRKRMKSTNSINLSDSKARAIAIYITNRSIPVLCTNAQLVNISFCFRPATNSFLPAIIHFNLFICLLELISKVLLYFSSTSANRKVFEISETLPIVLLVTSEHLMSFLSRSEAK